MNNIRAYTTNYHYFLWFILFEFSFGSPFFRNQTQAQNLRDVNIKTDNSIVSLEQAIKFIELNTKFSFTYNKETLPLEAKVQLTLGEPPLYDLLYSFAESAGVTFHRISNQIVVKKIEGEEKFFVIDGENNVIQGKVTDAKTNEPLAFVSVYLSGTTIGTTTNSEGIYRITSVPHGKYDLVASIVSYEASIVEIGLMDEITLQRDFFLTPKVYNLGQINVNDKIPEKWRKQLKYFKNLFLGRNKFVENCQILNEYKLEFVEDDEKFTAFVNEPLLINNRDLGYRLDCILNDFVFYKKSGITSYMLYPAFTEIRASGKDSIDNFIYNRNYAYLGSLAHLLSCLSKMNAEFREEGFRIGYIDGNSLYGSIDSAKQIVTYNSVTERYFINPRAGAIRKYKTWHSFSKKETGLSIHYFSPSKEGESQLFPTDGEKVEFDSGGYFINPNECIIYGEMAKEGVASMLPRFWKPAKEE